MIITTVQYDCSRHPQGISKPQQASNIFVPLPRNPLAVSKLLGPIPSSKSAEDIVHARRSGSNGITLGALSEAASSGERAVLNPETFRRMITLERKRSERSRKPFILLLLDMGDRPSNKNGKILGKISSVLSALTRDTDVTGWYSEESVVGVMFTEIAAEDCASIPSTIITRVTDTLRSNLSSRTIQPRENLVPRFSRPVGSRRSGRNEQSDAVPRSVAARRWQESVPRLEADDGYSGQCDGADISATGVPGDCSA